MFSRFPYQWSRGLTAWIAACGLVSLVSVAASAQPASDHGLTLAISPGLASEQLAQMSLEDLMNIEVTSVSRHRQKASDAPAAVTVITHEDIAHSGLNSIPELLRLAPGMNVARFDANDWAISARGFNSRYANKLLVLIDGRTVYAPLVSGVVWDQQDYVLADLDRIEMIRGPGATMWGANAVNGVVNIITKDAQETQGLLTSGLVGNVDRLGSMRYGGKLDEQTYYRIFGMFRKTEDFVDANGDSRFDGWQSSRGGFRLDRQSTPDDHLMLQAEAYQNLFADSGAFPVFGPPYVQPVEATQYAGGEHVLARWTHTISSESEYSLQGYYDRLYRQQPELGYEQHTWDLEFQHRFPLGDRQSLIWGAGARFLKDSTAGTEQVVLDPEGRDDYRLSAFVQDDITIVPQRVHFIAGSKFEYSSYSDFEYQPSARLLWTPSERQSVWGAVSRAVHTPTRTDQDVTALISAFPGTGGTPTGVVSLPNPGQKSEELVAYELGYRIRPRENLSIDVATFYNRYGNLRTVEPGAPITSAVPTVTIPVAGASAMDADSYGVEIGMNLNVTHDWRLAASYSLVSIEAHLNGSSTDTTAELQTEGTSPRNQAQIHSYYRVTRNLDFDASAYYVETLPAYDVPSYIRVDLGLTWHPAADMSLHVGVQNLLDDRHPEFGSDLYAASGEVPRAVYGQFSWQF